MGIIVAGKAVSTTRLWIFGISTTIVIVGILLQIESLYDLSKRTPRIMYLKPCRREILNRNVFCLERKN
jgi:hypothetical protein